MKQIQLDFWNVSSSKMNVKPETKQERDPSSPPPKKAEGVSSPGKVMAFIFWDTKGIVFIDYLQKGQIINKEHYANLLRQLQMAVRSK